MDRDRIMRKIGVSQKLFSKAQWNEAHAEAQGTAGSTAGDLLVERGTISREQLRGLERAVVYRIARNEDKELSRVIVDSGYADETAVEKALELQKVLYSKKGETARLCDLLLERGTLSESQHLAARKIHEIGRAARQETSADEESDSA